MDLSNILMVVGPAVLAVALVLVKLWLKASKYEAVVKAVALAVYPVVKAISEQTKNTVDDQVAMFLKGLNDGLAGEGHPPVDEAKAKALFAALNGAK